MTEPSRTNHGINLLQFRWVRTVALSPLFPYVFQAANLALVIALAILGWRVFAPEGVQAKQFAQTNLVSLLISGLWWPGVVWVAVVFGPWGVPGREFGCCERRRRGPASGGVPDTMKEPGSPRKVRLGAFRNPSVRLPFQETPACYTSVSTSTSGS